MEHPENDDLYAGLTVNKGIEQPPSINPYLKKRVRRKLYTAGEYVEGILKGPAFCMIYSAYKLNKQGDNIQP